MNNMKKIFTKRNFIISVLIIAIVIFVIFDMQIKNTEWKITQYGDNIGKQMMSFTIEGNKYGLVIIDGGYKDNEEQYNFLKNKISENDNIVDTWIITHFDSDHAGEFVRFASENEIKIKKIIVPNVPTDLSILKENAPNEEEWEIYEEYLKLNLPQKISVNANDKFNNIIGLKMKVLSSYADWIDEETDNLFNNGSIVFKLYGKKESLLFCGDVQDSKICNYIVENYRDDLKSDYLQVPHHGNNNMSEEFYKLVNPKVSFFCSPDWLIENWGNEPWYTVEDNINYLKSQDSEIVWYNTSPNIYNFK